jgi:arsenate reductase
VSDARGVEMYGLPHCTTCQKALKELAARGVAVARFRDVKEERLSEAEVRALAAKVGSPDAMFSRRALKYRAMGLHEKELSEEDLVRLMVEEYTFVTRPVIVAGERATAGWAPKRVDEMLRAEGLMA